jgi:hypothetical protein
MPEWSPFQVNLLSLTKQTMSALTFIIDTNVKLSSLTNFVKSENKITTENKRHLKRIIYYFTEVINTAMSYDGIFFHFHLSLIFSSMGGGLFR